MPPVQQILVPTPFVVWRKSPVFFDQPVAVTLTRTINDKALNGTRYGYGQSAEGYWFFVQMTMAQEIEFWTLFLDWRKTADGDHPFNAVSVDKLPPNCGTPNTPKC